MRHRTTTLFEANWLKLVSSTNPKTGRKHYIVKMVQSPASRTAIGTMAEVRALFDPAKNRGSKTGNSWKFRNRDEAEKLVTMALLTWGE